MRMHIHGKHMQKRIEMRQNKKKKRKITNKL